MKALPGTGSPDSPWAVLRHRDYRLFWTGQAVSGVRTFMQAVGQSLLVLKLSHNSATALGLVLLALAQMRTEVAPVQAASRLPLFASVREGLAAVVRDLALPWVVSGYGALLLLYAVQVLHVGGAQLGLLFLMVGADTLLASGVQVWLGSGDRHAGLFVVGLTVWESTLVVFALSTSLLLSAAALLLHGAARNVVGTNAVTLMQLRSPDGARGRVMSLNTLLVGDLRPLGDFGISAAMAATSVQGVVVTCGVLVVLYALAVRERVQGAVPQPACATS